MNSRTASSVIVLLAAFVVHGQQPSATPQVIGLRLKAIGPPLPSFRYELGPARADATNGNAALLYHRAIHVLGDVRPPLKEYVAKIEEFETARRQPGGEFPHEAARAFLRPFQSVFRELEAGARCDQCDWGTEKRLAAEGIGFLSPEAQRLRDLATLLAIRCRTHVAERKFDLAMKDIQTGLTLGRHAAQGPTLIHFLVGAAITFTFIGELEQALQGADAPNLYWSLTALPRPFLDLQNAVAGEMRTLETTLPLPKGIDRGPLSVEEASMAMERSWGVAQRLSPDGPEGTRSSPPRLAMAAYVTLQHPSARRALIAAGKPEAEVDAMPPAQVVLLESLVRFRNLRDQYFVWFQAPYAEAVQGMRRAEEQIRNQRFAPQRDLLTTLLGLTLPAFDRVHGAHARIERRLASLRAVEAVRLYAAEHGGRLPARLADVEVPVPVDPATGRAFEYTVGDGTFTIGVAVPPGEAARAENHWKYVVTVR